MTGPAEQAALLRTALRQRMQAAGLSARQLSTRAGMNESAVKQILNGRSISPRWVTLKRLADVLDCDPADLTGERLSAAERAAALHDVPPQPVAQRPAAPALAPQFLPRDVPILGTAECGPEGLFEMNGGAMDFAPRPPGVAHLADVYAIYAVGESMSPRYEHGDPVYVAPRRPVTPNCDVVIQVAGEDEHAPHRYFLKRLVRRTAEAVTVRQFNPDQVYDLPARRVLALHRVLTIQELLGL